MSCPDGVVVALPKLDVNELDRELNAIENISLTVPMTITAGANQSAAVGTATVVFKRTNDIVSVLAQTVLFTNNTVVNPGPVLTGFYTPTTALTAAQIAAFMPQRVVSQDTPYITGAPGSTNATLPAIVKLSTTGALTIIFSGATAPASTGAIDVAAGGIDTSAQIMMYDRTL